MKIRTKLFAASVIMTIPLLIIGYFSYIELRSIQNKLSVESMQDIQNLSKTTQLNSTSQFIGYYDEVLTQSARNYAFTGDKKWKDRYEQTAPLLDAKIIEAIKLGDFEDKQFFDSIDTSNKALVDMETKAIDLVDKGKKTEAVKILDGAEYSKQKDIYNLGLVEYVKKQGKNYSDVLTVSTDSLNNNFKSIQHALEMGSIWVMVGVALAILTALILAIVLSRLIAVPINLLNQAVHEIARGNLNEKVDVKSGDEIGELAKSFNEMADELRKSRENIEKRVAERTGELEQTNKYMVGRELKMIELKKRVMELEGKK